MSKTDHSDKTIRQPDCKPGIAKPAKEGDLKYIERTIAAPLLMKAEEIRAAEAEVPLEWNIGDVILDLYEVKDIHKGGGMGLVYRVRHRGWNIDLAVKSPRADWFKTEEQKENFVRECETWINLGLYPHTVSCYYVRTLGGIPRVFAEYVEGGSLSDWIKTRKLYEGGPDKTLERILDIAIQFAWGLHYAHEQGLIHQDVKPANVMMTPDGTAKVTDFGLAKARGLAGESARVLPGRSILVSTGGMTPAYCSPEQAQGKPLSRKTDIWSWGLSVLEMFTGEVTWLAGQAAAEALEGYVEAGIGDGAIPGMPEKIIEVLRRCFQTVSNDRPGDMQEVVAQLKGSYLRVNGGEYGRPEPKTAELLADGLNNQAVSLLDLGKQEEAEKLLGRALQADPHQLEATYNRGLLLWRSARTTDDVLAKQLEEVRKTHEGDWHAGYYLGLVHMERGDGESAAKILEQAAQQSPQEVEIQRALAVVRRSQENWHRCVRSFEGHIGNVESVSISPDGRWALSGSGEDILGESGKENTLWLWDLATGQCLRTFEGHTSPLTSVSISPDGRLALSGSKERTLRMWDLATGRCMRTFEGHTYLVSSVAFSPDGRWALSGSWDNTLRQWELATGECLHTFEGHADLVMSVAFSPDGRWGLSGSQDKTVRLWELATGQCVRTFAGHTDGVNSVTFSPDGCWALSGSWDRTLRLWDLDTGHCMRTFEGHANYVTSVSISPDGRWALSGSHDMTVRLWELATGQCVRTFEGHSSSVNSVSISPDGRWALSGSGDRTLRLWELATGQCVRTIEGHTDSVNSVAFSPDGRWALSGSMDQTLRLWELVTGQCVRTFEGDTFPIESVAFSRDGRWALSGGMDPTFRLWELATGQCVRTFEGHTVMVTSVSISPNGRWGLSGSMDQTLRLWELTTGQCVRTFEGHSNSVNSASFSPDGQWVLSGSEDNTLWLWELDWECEFPAPADWDEGALPYLESFLILHTPYAAGLPRDHSPSEEEIQLALTRRGKPSWSGQEFDALIRQLQYAGYGWLRPEGVRKQLEEMAKNRVGKSASASILSKLFGKKH